MLENTGRGAGGAHSVASAGVDHDDPAQTAERRAAARPALADGGGKAFVRRLSGDAKGRSHLGPWTPQLNSGTHRVGFEFSEFVPERGDGPQSVAWIRLREGLVDELGRRRRHVRQLRLTRGFPVLAWPGTPAS